MGLSFSRLDSPKLAGGSLRTVQFARKHDKPWLHVSAADPAAAERLRSFLEDNVIGILNVAGPRQSKEPHVGRFVETMLDRAFGL